MKIEIKSRNLILNIKIAPFETITMKKMILFVSFLIIAITTNAQEADDILGKWQSGHGNGRIQIFKRDNLYYGKIIWLNEPNDESGRPKRDVNNPNESLKARPIIGLEVLKDFVFKGNGAWSNGKVYDPKSGNTYNCLMNMPDQNKLNIRAFFGISLLGRTETWTRVQ
jgi:uncharacterized protein (DUF2147 family)